MIPAFLLMSLLDADTRLSCRLEAVAETPSAVRFVVRNEGETALAVLAWNTPLEGLLPKALVVRRDDQALPFEGPVVKRGDPAADDYVTVPARGQVEETVDLADGYALAPGPYDVTFEGRLHDVAPPAAVPRPRSAHQGRLLACGPLRLQVR